MPSEVLVLMSKWIDPSALSGLHNLAGKTRDQASQIQWRDPHLCSFCEKLFTGTRKDKPLGITGEYPTNQTLLEVELSAQNGCHLCFIRMENLSTHERAELQGCVQIQFGFWTDKWGLGLAFEYFYPVDPAIKRKKPCLSKDILLVPAEGKSLQ